MKKQIMSLQFLTNCDQEVLVVSNCEGIFLNTKESNKEFQENTKIFLDRSDVESLIECLQHALRHDVGAK